MMKGISRDLPVMLWAIGSLGIMILPLPPVCLDALITTNIALSILMLFVAFYVKRPLDFSVFPTLLLLITLFRLSINVASTRLILLRGEHGIEAAGKVIKTFGSFVAGGNTVVGLIIFLILIVINFVVITKGAGRIAEVAARFTLDALPGKQMSIDADLNAGLINEQEARRRRRELEAQADFYGAMDGASKFVRGDAIAGLIITFVNILGGLIIGVLQKKMPLNEALRTYTILTIGDGLVSQIPALLVSTAAGVVISRASAETEFAKDMGRQLFFNPKALTAVGLVLFLLAFVPGFPKPFFFLLALIAGGVSYMVSEKEAKAKEEVKEEREEEVEVVEPFIQLDLLELQIGYELVPLVDKLQGGELLQRIKAMRIQLGKELGIVVPPIHIRDNLQLKPSEYVILLKGVEVGRGELRLGYLLALLPGLEEKGLEGIKTKDPAFGLPALWIKPEEKEKALRLGATVVDPVTVLITHLMEIIRRNAHELLTRQDVQNLLSTLARHYPKVVEEVVPNLVSLGTVQKVLQNLLRERVPIKDLLTIIETIGDWAPFTKDPNLLTEYVRQALSRTLSHLYQTNGTIYAIVLDKRLEEALSESIQKGDFGEFLAPDPLLAERFLLKLKEAMEKVPSEVGQVVLITSPKLRVHIRRLIEHILPLLPVLSPAELSPEVRIKTVAVVSADD
jgi:flagellar biosynthesis protein FlhA